MAFDLSADGNLINDSLIAGLIASYKTAIDAATAIAVADGTVFIEDSSVARAHTLADGTVDGAHVIVFKTGGAGVGTITPATFTDGTSIPVTNAGDLVSFTWKDSSWVLNTAVNVDSGTAISVTP